MNWVLHLGLHTYKIGNYMMAQKYYIFSPHKMNIQNHFLIEMTPKNVHSAPLDSLLMTN